MWSAQTVGLNEAAEQGAEPVPLVKVATGALLATLIAALLAAACVLALGGGDQLLTLGYVGVFAVALATSATVFLPVPGVAVVVGAGAMMHPLVVGIVAGFGATTGELTGFHAGRLGGRLTGPAGRAGWIRRLMSQGGGPLAAALAFVPGPLFDAAGYLSGARQMRVWTFLSWCAAGKVPKMVLFAYAGASAPSLLGRVFGTA